MHGVAPQMCRSSSPSIVRRRSRGSLPRLPLTPNKFSNSVSGGFLLAKRPRVNGLHCLREETVTSWNDWRMAVVWLMAVGIVSMIYFLPAAHLIE
jgi:hypothetical protein